LEALPAEELAADQLQGVLRGCARLRARVAAVEARALSALARLAPRGLDGASDLASWLARETHVTRAEAHRAVRRAGVLAALGERDAAAAQRTVMPASVDVVASVVPRSLWPAADELLRSGCAPEELRLVAQRWVQDRTGNDGAASAAQQKASQELRNFMDHLGMSQWRGKLTPADAAVVDNALDRVIDELWRAQHPTREPERKDEPEPYPYRRAEALLEMARRTLAGNAPATNTGAPRRAQPSVVVVIDYQSLLGQLGCEPMRELIDGTPLPAATIRRLACDAGVLPVVMGGPSEVLDMGRRVRSATDAQRAAVMIRDRHCRFVGCTRRAGWSDVHHIHWWTKGGPTDLNNLILLCGHHHHLVHEGGWQLRGNAQHFTIHRPDGTIFDPDPARGPPDTS
jgi:hypothetical protein